MQEDKTAYPPMETSALMEFFDTDAWEWKHYEVTVPQQENGSDCGPFTCAFGTYVNEIINSDVDPKQFFEDNGMLFGQEDATAFKKHIFRTILTYGRHFDTFASGLQ